MDQVEVIYNGRLTFGNFLHKKPDSNALVIKLASGRNATVDVGQVVSVWDIVADEKPPSCPATWAQVTTDALNILRNMSPKKK